MITTSDRDVPERRWRAPLALTAPRGPCEGHKAVTGGRLTSGFFISVPPSLVSRSTSPQTDKLADRQTCPTVLNRATGSLGKCSCYFPLSSGARLRASGARLKSQLSSILTFETILNIRTRNPVTVLDRYITLGHSKIITVRVRGCLQVFLTYSNLTVTP